MPKENDLENLFENLNYSYKNEEIDKQKIEVLEDYNIKKIIEELNLNEEQINSNINYLYKYYQYLKTNNKKPSWKLYVNTLGQLKIDFSNDKAFLRAKKYDNFWLTKITPLDEKIEEYFENLSLIKPSKIESEAKKAYPLFPAGVQNHIKQIVSSKEFLVPKGLYLIDDNFIYARNILKFISAIYGIIINKTVAFLDASNLYNFIQSILREQSELKNIISLLNDVDCLIIDRLGVGVKPEWYINMLNEIFLQREYNQKPTYISSPIDLTLKDEAIIFNSKNNSGLAKAENLFKNTIKRNYIKCEAKKV
ncbi:hypothetical protein [Mycoplasma struthionis]|uniref:Uncharacterized protein n=1 Tax=Mycoplasma struthionis TaxID=538220 RepID=A0A3G8LFY9_9MOLU|nr:hypothetical protein [Mycoplasma struthionis]AZG68573.1 hypothetical protein EGN60_01120 [Mycoplasma struthionis]TPI02403.1 hypothetical protein FJM01_00965 [Mycoplasma struthionis]